MQHQRRELHCACVFCLQGLVHNNTVTDDSIQEFESWKDANCQPNYYVNLEGSDSSCPPYTAPSQIQNASGGKEWANEDNHDTIGMVVCDAQGLCSCGTSTNGANHKVRHKHSRKSAGSFAFSR
jgi:N4-(beta-N-acetylglucosaminyl)-L-asparaginase